MKYKLTIGDWGGDGHNISEDVFFETDSTATEIRDAYKRAVNHIGVSLDNITRSDNLEVIRVCVEYEDHYLTTEAKNRLGMFMDLSFLEEETIYETWMNVDSLATLFLEMVKTQIPDFRYEIIPDTTEAINGYGVGISSIGYGCFS